jgi:peptidoglycan/xylan/chitin deacetylase (PgdA/CDA1 family)
MKVPILLYHALFECGLKKEKYAIKEAEFEQQIRYLSAKGFQSLLLGDLFKSHAAVNNDNKSVAITFDDGNHSDFSLAFPILKKCGFVATFFITVNYIGNENYVSWANLSEMLAGGMSIQSHSLNHVFLSDLSEENIYSELNESRNILRDRLKSEIKFISLPGGFFSKRVLTVAKSIGYEGVCTSIPGMNIVGEGKRGPTLLLNRFVITRETSFEKFKAIVNGDRKYRAACKAQHYFKAGMKKILGSQRYYELWYKFFRE